MMPRSLLVLCLITVAAPGFAACSSAPAGEEEEEATPVKKTAAASDAAASSTPSSTPSGNSTPIDIPLSDAAVSASDSATTDGGAAGTGGTAGTSGTADSGGDPGLFPCTGGGKLEQEPNDSPAAASIGSTFASMAVPKLGTFITTAMCGGLGFFGDKVDHMKFTIPAEAAGKSVGWAFETAFVADITIKVTAGGETVTLAGNASLPAGAVGNEAQVEIAIAPGKTGLYRVLFFYGP